MREWQEQGRAGDVCAYRHKGLEFFRRLAGADPGARHRPWATGRTSSDLIGAIKVMLDAYRDGKIDRLLLVHNEFVNTMTQKARVQQLLPLQTSIDQEQLQERWDYIYEPEAVADPRRPADALHRVAGLPGRGRERRLRDGGAHGRHEERHRQRRQAHRRAAARYTTRPVRRRSRRNFRKSSAARQRFEDKRVNKHVQRQDHADHRRSHRR